MMLEQSAQELEFLSELTKGGKLEHRYRERLLIIKTYEVSKNKRGTGRDLGIDIQVVRRWLSRWDNGELVRNDLYELYSRFYVYKNCRLMRARTRAAPPM